MRRYGLLLISAAIVVAVALAGCGGSSGAPPAVDRTPQPPNAQAKIPAALVSGTIAIYGGIALTPKVLKAHPCGCWYYAGTVRLTATDGKRVDIPVGKSGHFTRRVPTGRYTVVGGLTHPNWPMGSCNMLFHSGHYDQKTHSFYIVVANGQRVHVHVECAAL